MRGYLEDEKTSWLAFIACFISYAVICMTKNTYSAALAAIVQEGLFSKSSAGIINSCFYIFYGSTQFIGGYLADRSSPFKIILVGLVGSIIANAVMAISSSFYVMLIAWSFNGVAQFGIWPAILKIISTTLIPEHRQKGKIYIAFAYCVGMMISYLAAMVVLENWRWPVLFTTSAIVLILTTAFFFFVMGRVRKNIEHNSEEYHNETSVKANSDTPKASVPLLKLLISSGLLFMLIPALIRCMLDLGLKSWVPTMIMENYGTSPGFSSLLTALLLLINLSGVFMVVELYPKRCKNAVTALVIFFVASLPLLLLLFFIGKIALIFIIILLALITTFMNAGNQLFNVVLPTACATYGKTGIVAGMLNAFACFGNVIANFIYGLIAEKFGWNITIFIWMLLSVVAIIFCFISAPKWKAFTEGKLTIR